MHVTVAQPACVDGDVRFNVDRHAAVVRAARSRVVVFPEMSLTGFVLTAPPVEERLLAPLVAACRDTRTIALVGAPVDGSIATLAVTGDGVRVAYRKVHLHGDELDHFVPGPGPAVLTVDGWRLGLAVCYDAALPEHAAATADAGIDAYVVSALYPDTPESLARRDAQVPARAAAHGVYGILAAFAGPTGTFPGTSGGSAVWAPDGRRIVDAGPDPDATAGTRLSGVPR